MSKPIRESSLGLAQTVSSERAAGTHATLDDENVGTLAGDSSGPPRVDPGVAPVTHDDFATRYELRRVIGEGGMGQVRLCRDRHIGRDVALKVMRAGTDVHPSARARFLREARVQGQLEHPAVVPVYDLDVTEQGAPFFTMKRVRGATLEQIVDALAVGDAAMAERFGRRRLLAAFSSLCLAIDFAHARGVLHRDLKPGNVMLGDFGEVHVLDWGLARLADQREPGDEGSSLDEMPTGQTLQGQLLGTPGYMAPEQIRGEIDALSPRTDVFALGAILFELLTYRTLIDGPSASAMLHATLAGVEARPSVRAPEAAVAPELEAICVRATAHDPSARHASARELSEAIERYLDGDRDLQRRAELADQYVERARAARLHARGLGEADARLAQAAAMRALTQALALSPQHPAALGLLAHLLTETPERLPPEAVAEIEATAREGRSRAAAYFAARYAFWIGCGVVALAMGVRDLSMAVVTFGALVLSAALAAWMSRARRVEMPWALALLAISATAIGLISVVSGPFIVVPGLAATNTVFFAMHAERRHRGIVLACGLLSMLVPLALDGAGIVPPPYAFHGDAFTVFARAVSFPPWITPAILCLLGLATIVTPTIMVSRMRDALAAAEERLVLQSWHLRQLLPDEARASLRPPPEEGTGRS